MNENKYLVDARNLKTLLTNKSSFSTWLKRKIERHKLKENIDYILKMQSTCKNYFFTMKAAEKIILNYPRNKTAQKIKQKIEAGKEINDALEEIKRENEAAITIITISDNEYPERLRKIKNPPQKLYVKGEVRNLKEYGIAVIGSRRCSNYGRRICKIFAKNLTGYGLCIISGLAVGIDACAHKSCVEAKGKTIAVLPSGFNNIFPKENEVLLNKIIDNGGTIVTEYPPEFEKTPESCRQRNRIISGLAIGTLVIEAGDKSGTTSTVKHTNEANKKAFCVPGNLINSKSVGTNKMIKENEAQLVTEVEDIIKEFPELKLKRKEDFQFAEIKRKKKSKEKESTSKTKIPDLEEENLEIYNCLKEEAKDIDEIAQVLNKTTNEVAYKLTLLELEGIIEELPGKKFKIKKGR